MAPIRVLDGICYASAAIAITIVAGSSVPALLGYRMLLVSGGSMSPGMNPGDVILVRPEPAASVHVGDVITFAPVFDGGLKTHRVIAVQRIRGKLYFRTQGDANDSADPDLASPRAVLGVVRHRIPVVGYWLHAATTRWARLVFLGIPAIILSVQQAVELARSLRARARRGRSARMADEDARPWVTGLSCLLLLAGGLVARAGLVGAVLADRSEVIENAFRTAASFI